MKEDAACKAIEKYYTRHKGKRSQAYATAYASYWETGWIRYYKKRGFQLYYTNQLFRRRVSLAKEAFDRYLNDVEAGTTVVSIGCGPGPELAAAHELIKSYQSVNNVRFLGVDSEPGWERLFRAWTNRVACRGDRFYWWTEKITNQKKLIKLLNEQNASVVIFSYFLLDFEGSLNPRRLMKRVPSLQHVIIFDNQRIRWEVNDAPSSKETIYRDDYLFHRRTRENSRVKRVEKVQVLAYSRSKMITAPGFAITLKLNSVTSSSTRYTLTLAAGCFKSVEHSIASLRRSAEQMLVPFVALNDEITHNDLVNLVAPKLAAAAKISVSAHLLI